MGQGGANAPLDFLRGGVAPPPQKGAKPPLIISAKVRFKVSIFAPPDCVVSPGPEKAICHPGLGENDLPPQCFEGGTKPTLNLTPAPPPHMKRFRRPWMYQ